MVVTLDLDTSDLCVSDIELEKVISEKHVLRYEGPGLPICLPSKLCWFNLFHE